MSVDKVPNDDYISKWSDNGIDMLYEFMQSEQLALQTLNPRDPFILAQGFQQTLDATESADFREIMGVNGERTLNESAVKTLTCQRLAIITDRLFTLEAIDEDEFITGDYDKTVLITGLFREFQFGRTDDKDRLSVELVDPQFLRPRLDIRSELFARADRFLVPVESITARLYDPLELIN